MCVCVCVVNRKTERGGRRERYTDLTADIQLVYVTELEYKKKVPGEIRERERRERREKREREREREKEEKRERKTPKSDNSVG